MIRIFVGCLIVLHATGIAGEDRREEAGFAFLRVTPDAYSYSLGNGVALANNWQMTEWNPAGIGFLDDASLRYDYKDHLAGISLHTFSGGMGLSSLAKIGVSYRRMTYGTVERTTESDPDGTIGTYRPYEEVFSVTVARQVLPWISIGASLKRVGSQIDKLSADGTLYDVGVIAIIPIEMQRKDIQHTLYFGASAGDNLIGALPVYKTKNNDTVQVNGPIFISEPFNVRRNLRAGLGWGVAWFRDYSFESYLKMLEMLGHFSLESYSYRNVFVSDPGTDAGDMEMRAGIEVKALEILSLRLSTRNLRRSNESFISRKGVGLRLPFLFFVKKPDVVVTFDYASSESGD
jgi:hypothetical protein